MNCLPTSPIPTISIDFAPFEDDAPQDVHVVYAEDEDESYRSNHLVPPPVISPIRGTQAHRPSDKKGLERERFETLLKISRQRNTFSKKPLELRKEVTLKAHQNKQAERRALFHTRLGALPSPTATDTPVTPPDSPAVFHFSLPSPGLVSPLALFEALDKENSINREKRQVWIERVDFRAQRLSTALTEPRRDTKRTTRASGRPSPPLPSLDQISARLVHDNKPATPSGRAPIPLPAFLSTRASVPAAPASARIVPTRSASPVAPVDKRTTKAQAMMEKLKRRVSAPAGLPVKDMHPILLVPGGF